MLISISYPSPIGVFLHCFSFVAGEAGPSELGLGTTSCVVTYWWSTCLVSPAGADLAALSPKEMHLEILEL